MISLKRLMDAKIIDCHVHNAHSFADVRVEFPSPFQQKLLCQPGHMVRCIHVTKSKYIFQCTECGKITYNGDDPFWDENIFLLNHATDNELVFPFIIVSPEMGVAIEKYEKNFGENILGYKLHPNFSQFSLKDISLSSKKILLIHSCVGLLDNAELIVDFAEHYNGKVIIAHMGRFNKNAFDRARQMDNVYFDCSSIGLIWQSYNNHQYNLCDTSYLGAFKKPADLLSAAMEYVGIDKVVFGSDEPFGCFEKDIKIVNELSEDLRSALLSRNMRKILEEQINV